MVLIAEPIASRGPLWPGRASFPKDYIVHNNSNMIVAYICVHDTVDIVYIFGIASRMREGSVTNYGSEQTWATSDG
jgi:hypothetical protein